MCLQETKLKDADNSIFTSLWPHCSSIEGAFIAFSGNLGGILSLWDSNKIKVINNFKGDRWIGIYCTIISSSLEYGSAMDMTSKPISNWLGLGLDVGQ